MGADAAGYGAVVEVDTEGDMSKQHEALQVADDCLCGADPGVYPQTYLGDRLMRAGDVIRRLHASLVAGGFTDEGGELWKPPLGPSALPLLERLDKQQALIEEMREALKRIAGSFDESWTEGGVERHCGDLARAALAKAEAQG